MTLRQWAEDSLYQRGMFPEQARAVIDIVAAGNESIKDRWNDDTEGYPDTFLAVLIITIDHAALEWIDANKPQAWYRPMFDHSESTETTP